MAVRGIICFLLVLGIVIVSHGQVKEETIQRNLESLQFMEGTWKACAQDSSFSSVLSYEYSDERKLLFTTNYLYNKKGKLFRNYEGVYLVDSGDIIFIISGPAGEIHRGTVTLDTNKVATHLGRITPGTGIKSYRSEMHLSQGKLHYLANYSKKLDFPTNVDRSNRLIYSLIEK